MGPSGPRLRSDRRKQAPQPVEIEADGRIGTGRRFWFIPGKFRFCPACKHAPASQAREYTKLASLSAEGRSSATTLLVSSTLRWMNEPASTIPTEKRKLLGFTDNRQDAALQAGHFNDFLFVSLLRAATLAAVRKAGPEGLTDSDMGGKVQAALGFVWEKAQRRKEWMAEPEAKGRRGDQHCQDTCARPETPTVGRSAARLEIHEPNLEELGLFQPSI